MKTKNLVAVIAFVVGGFSSFAQSNLLNAKTPDQIGKKTQSQVSLDNDKPLAYGYVDDRDILMGKTVWEIVDLSERFNFPLYFPIDSTNIGKDRRSLFDVLIKGIKTNKITEVYADDYFNTKKTFKDMSSSFTYIDTTNAGREEVNANRDLYFPKEKVGYKTVKGKKVKVMLPAGPAKVLDPQFIDKRELTAQDITGYRLKGYWYFDKRQSELKYRLLGICPVAPEAREVGNDNADYIDLFWIFYPSVRDYLHGYLAFNEKNSAMPVSFDRILDSRQFSGVIYKEENVYGDRLITEYINENALNQLLESDRIKDKIRDFEHDMWNY
ncbi:gliding motility protein GldN [Flavobacterium aquiphilum]|uniref:type IX secretion system ring protein PorN/GldN n=1 Tax=Flavobacterium aquiphilum TaxID=3003261 RepID=UPI0024816BF8|nr:gliding motility protein GldN [Flavobacterium aquiphilum]